MFEQNVINAVSALFEMQCVEYSGETKNGGVIYLTYDDINVSITAEQEKITTAICTLSMLAIEGREGIGFISGKLFDFDSKVEGIKIEAYDKSEDRRWLANSVFEVSKQVRITEKVDFNQSRELIKNFELTEG
ncbi:MAG: hypothetical protein ACRCXG_16220 [Vibrio sp.]